MQSENTADLSAALAKAQGAMQAAKFDKMNPHFKNKYASLAAVIDAIRKPLADNGLSYTQTTEIRDHGFVLVTTLRHGNQWIASEFPLPAGLDPQKLGSALTYAKRYSLSAIVCISADEDDDAEGARKDGNTNSTPGPKQSPIKPAHVEPPVNPQTGEVSPHTITAPGVMEWGAAFVAAINASKTSDEFAAWLAENAEALDHAQNGAPKVYDRVMVHVKDRMAYFKKAAAA